METRYTLLVLYGENPPVIGEYPSRRANHVQLSGLFSLSGCTRTVEHGIEVPCIGDPNWIWPSGGPAVLSTLSALLQLPVASQL